MSTITAIETQKRRSIRRSIFVDGEFVIGAHEEVIAALGLAVGQTFDNQRLAELVEAETAGKARERALRLINYRDRTSSEIRRRLLGSDFPEKTVVEVVDQLKRAGLLDDEKFSRDWVKSRTASKPMGKLRLVHELRARGVDARLVEKAVESVDGETERQLAHSLASRKLDKMDAGDPTTRTRLISFLRRRGFGWEIASEVVDSLCPDGDG